MAAPTKKSDVPFTWLPDELFVEIFAKLPLVYMFQLRVVCKRWNAGLRNPNFQSTRRTPLCAWRTEKEYAVFNPETNSWQSLPTSFISRHNSWHKVWGVADGCLLVARTVNLSEREFYLTNPMTRFYKELFNDPNRDLTILGMVFDKISKSYKIFGVRDGLWKNEYYFESEAIRRFSLSEAGEYGKALYVYDSSSEIGEGKLIVKRGWDKKESYVPISHRGVFHRLIMTYMAKYPIYKVLCYDGGQSWHQLTAQIPRYLLFVHMFDWEGNLMIVGGKGTNQDLSSVTVWKLNEEKNTWMETMTMPDDLLHCFFLSEPISRLRLHCESSGDFLSLTSYPKDPVDHIYLTLYSRGRHVMCNLSKNSWWEVAKPPSPYKQNFDGARYFMWKPSFL